jgi:hypothetical protein
VDLNQPPKLDEDRKDDAEGEDLDPKFLICDVRGNGIKLDVVLEVIFFMKHVAKDIPHICLRKILELMRSELMLLFSYKSCAVNFQISS